MSRYEVWADILASEGFRELTSFPTIARLIYSGDEMAEAERKAAKALCCPEVVAASVRVVEED